MWVNFSISEQWIQNYRNEIAKKTIVPPADEAYEVEIIQVDGSVFPQKGRITFKAPIYNPTTGTFLIRVTLDNPAGILRPNQYVQARVKGAVRPGAMLVPQRAVQQGAKGHFVWVVTKDGKAENRPVAVGEWNGDDWFINEGLKAGEDVVVDGGLTLQPGAAVSAKPWSAGTAPKDKPAKKGD
jgi:membrane fusion protein (multidrug efflux system)